MTNNPRLWLWLLILFCAAALILWSDGAYDVDDAPITYRYAERLAAGQGFTYNNDEPILGTSTPLYTLLLAGARVIGVAIPNASSIINFVSSLAVVWVTMMLAAEISGAASAGVLAALYLLVQGSFLRFSMSGMETPLYTLLIMATFFLAVKQRPLMAAVLAGLAFIMRLDGLAVGGALFLGLWIQHKKVPWREGLLYLCVLLPWILFAFWYFGSPIPLSMIAKQEHLQEIGGDRYWIWEHLFITTLDAPRFLLPLALPGLLVAHRQNRQTHAWAIPLLWLLAYLVAYTIVGIDFYEWYLMPAYPVIALFVGIGLGFVLNAMTSYTQPGQGQLLPGLAALLVLGLWLWPYGQHMVNSINTYKTYLQLMEGSRVQAGAWLRANAPPNSKVLAGAIGHVGYASGFYIIDSAGLVTPFTRRQELYPDYTMLEGYTPRDRECGALYSLDTGFYADHWGHLLISGCHLPALGRFGDFTLSNSRISNWVRNAKGEWQAQPLFYLETQWLIEKAQPAAPWTLFVHFTDSAGRTLFQADHELGLQLDRSLRQPVTWEPTQRIYVYAEMPEEWATQRANVAAIRVGLWNPQTRAYLPPAPGYHSLDNDGRLVIPLQDDELVSAMKS